MTEKKKTDQNPEQLLIQELKKQIEELTAQIKPLEQAAKDQEEMTKRAQHDYINLKMDFDRFKSQYEANKESNKRELQIEAVKKFLPFVETMRKSLESLDDNAKETALAQGVALMYKNFLSTLESIHIKPIEALGLEPDTNLHEPVGAQPVQDEKQKGKIIQEFERGFIYAKEGEQRVITTSKVVIGQ